jgi:hypothetical protein
MVVFHVTPESNIPSILMAGISPSYCTGRMACSWYVAKFRIEWALLHLSVHYQLSVDKFQVCAVLVDSIDMYKFFQPGYYFTYKTYKIESATPAMHFIHTELRQGE